MPRCSCSSRSHDHPRRIPLRRGLDRRDVLKFALSGAGIAALGPWVGKRLPIASGAPLGNKILVVVNMDGGCDTLNTVIPVTLSNYYSRRPTIAVPSASALDLTGGPGTNSYKFHPNMTRLQALWNDGDVAFSNKVGYPNANLSHFESQDFYSFGVVGDFGPLGIPASGWIARYADDFAPTPLGAVSIGAGKPRSFIGGSSNPLQVGSLAGFNFSTDRINGGNSHLYRMQIVKDILANSTAVGTPGELKVATQQAHDLTTQIQTARTNYDTYYNAFVAANPGVPVYANQTLSRNLKDVAALIHGGFETRVFYTLFGGFDTHSDEGQTTGQHPNLMAQLDTAIGAFAADMRNLGQWDNVLILVITEFGRRNFENASLGTDHAESFCELMVGGPVNGGNKGPDITNTNLGGDGVAYAVDFRDIYREALKDHLGVSDAGLATVFPEAQPINSILNYV
jgi:uncharacterized protein (DUF1501 family)